MNISIITVGSLKTSWVKEGCAQYRKRLPLDIIEVPASKQKDPLKQAAEESATLLKRLEKMDGVIWVLDEHGETYTSPAFAQIIESAHDRGEKVIFVLGGAYGLSDTVKAMANRLIRLSDMVLPHELCRVVLLEQIYRAGQISKKTGYHH